LRASWVYFPVPMSLPSQLVSVEVCACVAGNPRPTSTHVMLGAPAAVTARSQLHMKRWLGTSGTQQTGTD